MLVRSRPHATLEFSRIQTKADKVRDKNMNFEPYTTEPQKEDAWWVRIVVYVIGTTTLAALCALIVFFQQSGVGNKHIARRNLDDIERSNRRILLCTKIAGGLGAALGMAASINYEFKTRKERADF
jgi:hypothetical protein